MFFGTSAVPSPFDMMALGRAARAIFLAYVRWSKTLFHAAHALVCRPARPSMDASAIASWPDHDSIPLGVIVTKIRASSPSPIQLGEPGAQLLCLDSECIERLCAYEAGSLLPHVHALVQMNKAMAAVEQDVLAMWAAGMYEGALHVRLLARCHASASGSSGDHMVHWQHILSCLWIDAHLWSAISRETDSPVACTPFWDTALVCMDN